MARLVAGVERRPVAEGEPSRIENVLDAEGEAEERAFVFRLGVGGQGCPGVDLGVEAVDLAAATGDHGGGGDFAVFDGADEFSDQSTLCY